MRTVEVVEQYQLNHSYKNAQHEKARTEDALAAG